MTETDDLRDELDHIRVSRELASELPMTADPRRSIDLHMPRLLAALDEVLKLADEWNELWPCSAQVREAVSRALTGQEPRDRITTDPPTR